MAENISLLILVHSYLLLIIKYREWNFVLNFNFLLVKKSENNLNVNINWNFEIL